MNSNDLADQLAGSLGTSKAGTRKLVNTIFAAIVDAAAKGDEIALSGFGKFKIKENAAREGRNPATGETITIAASRKLGFTPSKAIKDLLNG